MTEIFSVNGLVAPIHKRNGILYTCAAKVCLMDSLGRSIIGYVVDEDEDDILVLMENDRHVKVSRPIFDVRHGCYSFGASHDDDGEYSIGQYWPIRFKVNTSGATCFTLNRVVMKGEGKVAKNNI